MNNNIFQDNKDVIFLFSLQVRKNYYYLQIFNTLKRLQIKCGGRCLEEATYCLNDVIFCASWRFCEELASSKDSHGSKMLRRLSIFVVLENILDLRQIFRIVKISVKILYLHWVEGTPQLCPFPGVRSGPDPEGAGRASEVLVAFGRTF